MTRLLTISLVAVLIALVFVVAAVGQEDEP